MDKLIGKKVQECRKKKGFTQEELAETIEISPHHLSTLERGVYSIKLETPVKILNCLAYGIPKSTRVSPRRKGSVKY